MSTFIFMILAYLLGSISTAIIVCKALGLADPRTEGSKNPGATNVLRIAGKQAAMGVLAADALKGMIPVLLARFFGVSGFGLGMVALAATAGHIFPAYYKFKGGKGVATAIGGFIGLSFLGGLIAGLLWVATAAITRYASLSSVIAVGVAPVLLVMFGRGAYFTPVIAIAALVIWRHMENIQQLKAGTEDKMTF